MMKPRRARNGARVVARSALVAPIALLLAACAGSNPVDSQAPRGCPGVSILRDVDRTLIPVGDGTSAAVAFQSISGECAYSSQDVTVDVDAVLAGQRESGSGGTARVRYFVAVIDPFDTILNKQVFQTDLPFSGASGQQLEQLRQIIPLNDLRAGADYRVILGFQP